MKYNKLKYKQEITNSSLIGSPKNRALLQFQTEMGIALRGGSLPLVSSRSAAKRLVHTINILNRMENQELIFSEITFKH